MFPYSYLHISSIVVAWSRVKIIRSHLHHWIKGVWWNAIVVVFNTCSILFSVVHRCEVSSPWTFTIKSDSLCCLRPLCCILLIINVLHHLLLSHIVMSSYCWLSFIAELLVLTCSHIILRKTIINWTWCFFL